MRPTGPNTRAVLLALLAVLGLSACGGGRVAIVDSDRILNESVRALSYQKQLDEREKTMALDLQLLRRRPGGAPQSVPARTLAAETGAGGAAEQGDPRRGRAGRAREGAARRGAGERPRPLRRVRSQRRHHRRGDRQTSVTGIRR